MNEVHLLYYKRLIGSRYNKALRKIKKSNGVVRKNYFNYDSYVNQKKEYTNNNKRSFNLNANIDSNVLKELPFVNIHHDLEDKYTNLSDRYSCYKQGAPFKTQKAQNLTRVDLIEHVILHALILEKKKVTYKHSIGKGFNTLYNKLLSKRDQQLIDENEVEMLLSLIIKKLSKFDTEYYRYLEMF